MKKIILYSFTALLTGAFIPAPVKAATAPGAAEISADSAWIKSMLENKLKDIRRVNRSEMNHADKKALRIEERAIGKALHDGYGGVYISVGALIIIILLLIILF